MKATRRQCLGLGAAALAAASLTGCRSFEQIATAGDIDKPQLATLSDDPALRLLQRATYGPASYDIDRIGKLGVTGWLSEQMLPDAIDEPMLLKVRLEPLRDITDADPGLLFDIDDHQAIDTLTQATILRAAYSRRQLYERMVGFWSDHFNIFAFKGEGPQYKVVDDRLTIRPHALGRFRDLLGASARSAAMLGYLDNAINKKGVPNENYARELLELHTLGVNTGYTQHDVQNVARCFTGWSVQGHWRRGNFNFEPSEHDMGAKTVLGHHIPAGGGLADAETVLDIVAAHPATATHITRKLCLAFLGTAPDDLHKRLSATFLRTGGQIKPVLQEMLAADGLHAAVPQLKRPFDFMIGTLRALGADTNGGAGIRGHLAAMGQTPFDWPMPDGYPIRDAAWVSDLLPRWRFAAALTGNQIDGTSVDWASLQKRGASLSLTPSAASIEALFARPAVSSTLSRLNTLAAKFGGGDIRRATAIALMSPEYQYR